MYDVGIERVREEGEQRYHDSLVKEPDGVPASHLARSLRCPGRADVGDDISSDRAAGLNGGAFIIGQADVRHLAHGVPDENRAVKNDARREVTPSHNILEDGDTGLLAREGAWSRVGITD